MPLKNRGCVHFQEASSNIVSSCRTGLTKDFLFYPFTGSLGKCVFPHWLVDSTYSFLVSALLLLAVLTLMLAGVVWLALLSPPVLLCWYE